MKKRTLPSIPSWLTTALQGLTFWIGYKRSLYRDYPLSEGALVTELRSLLHANLPDELFLKCEVGYSKLVKTKVRPTPIAGSTRADFVVASKIEDKESTIGWKYKPEFVFELKRAGANDRLIDKDLTRLAALRASRKGVRAFLIILSEADRHDRFVTDRGKTRLGSHNVPGFAGTYTVRRTVKASATFENRNSGNYATMVEVFPNENQPFHPVDC